MMLRPLSLRMVTHTAEPVDGPPTVDVIRRRLGGRASSGEGVGQVVRLRGSTPERLAVVLFTRGLELDVWVGGGVIRNTRRLSTVSVPPSSPSIPQDMAEVARDARVFASLTEGQRVRFTLGDGRAGEGTLAEKCRFGALILTDDQRVIGAAFRRVAPTAPSLPPAG